MPKYRTLVLSTWKHVFRIRLGREAPANFKPLRVRVLPGATLKQGYRIPFDMSEEGLAELK